MATRQNNGQNKVRQEEIRVGIDNNLQAGLII
jgi:hypothetical protein